VSEIRRSFDWPMWCTPVRYYAAGDRMAHLSSRTGNGDGLHGIFSDDQTKAIRLMRTTDLPLGVV
jgi:hypothetical protein